MNEIIVSAVETEKYFIEESLNVKLIGMNSDLMFLHIKFTADYLLNLFGYPKFYNIKCPFDFMENLSMQAKENFFEVRVSQYSLNNVSVKTDKEEISRDREIRFDEDF